jgi:site-specific DNA-methyltransferase (adenine-specific)
MAKKNIKKKISNNILKMIESDSGFKQNDKAVVIQEDCIAFLKSLPDESVDIIVTDPAYSGMNQKMKFGNGRIVGEYQKEGNHKWFTEFHDTRENYSLFLKECKRVLKDNRSIYIMFDSFSLLSLGTIVREYFDVKNIIVWDKINMGMGHNFRRRHELILFATKGKSKLNSKAIPDIWKVKRITQSEYPTQKPVEIFDYMIKASAKDGYIVCDPFLGSGSSAIASLKNNCIFIGCDVSSKACKVSRDRIKNFLYKGNDPLEKNILNNKPQEKITSF